jgi:uncharacterized protein YjiS (DUF1127 family)
MLHILILSSLSGGLRRLAASLSAAELSLREQRRKAIARRALHHLSDHTLKDIGICRSQFDPCWAESRVQDQTRLRLALHPRSGGWS